MEVNSNQGLQTASEKPAAKSKRLWLWAGLALIILVIAAVLINLIQPTPSSDTVPATDTGSTTADDDTATLSFDSAGVTSDPFSDPSGPFYHNVYQAFSTDGLNFTKDSAVLIEKASVPDALRMPDGTIFVYAVDGAQRSRTGIMVAKSEDNGNTWEKGSLQAGGSGGVLGADPQAVLLDNGKIRLFYLVAPLGQPGAAINPNVKNKVMSAISSDGINFTVEDGTRFEYAQITDPDVIKIGGVWFMYAAQGPKQIYATSTDGMTFSYQGSIRSQGSISKTVPVENDQYRQYFCKSGVASATSSDGINWKDDSGIRIAEDSSSMACDPSPVKTDSGWLMVYKVGPKNNGI